MIHRQYPYYDVVSGIPVESQYEMNDFFRKSLEEAFARMREAQATDYLKRSKMLPISPTWLALYEQELSILEGRRWVVGL